AVERRGRFEDRGRESSLRLGEVDDVAAWFEGAARGIATEIAASLRQRERLVGLAHFDPLEAQQVDHLSRAHRIAPRCDNHSPERPTRWLGERGLVEGTVVLESQ